MRSPVRISGVFLAVLACVPLASCQLLDKVEEDRRTEYLKSRTLPDLEIPPDLVAASAGEPLAIPGEESGEELGQEPDAAPGEEPGPAPGEELPETLAAQEEAPGQPERQDTGERAPAAEADAATPAGTELTGVESQSPTVAGRRVVPSPPLAPDWPASNRAAQRRDASSALTEQLVAVQGDWQEVWPLLREFWGSKGLALDLEDRSLGVMETVWTVPYLQQDMTVRNRFKLFLEPGTEEGVLHVVLSSEKEVYLEQEENREGDWLLQDPDLLLEKKYASELQGFLGKHL